MTIIWSISSFKFQPSTKCSKKNIEKNGHFIRKNLWLWLFCVTFFCFNFLSLSLLWFCCSKIFFILMMKKKDYNSKGNNSLSTNIIIINKINKWFVFEFIQIHNNDDYNDDHHHHYYHYYLMAEAKTQSTKSYLN